MPRDESPDTDRSAAHSAPSSDAFDMLYQLTREVRDDVKRVRTQDLPEISERVTRLEALVTASARPRPQVSTPVKAAAGATGLVALIPVVIWTLQTLGVLPPPAPGTPAPPPALTAAP